MKKLGEGVSIKEAWLTPDAAVLEWFGYIERKGT